MPASRIAALALAVAVVAPGCGAADEETQEFRDGYNAAVERLNAVNSKIEESGEELATKPGRQIGREFERIANVAARTRLELARLDPPDDARDEFDRLLAAVAEGVRDTRAVAEAARREDQEGFVETSRRLSQTGDKISEAEDDLKRAVEG